MARSKYSRVQALGPVSTPLEMHVPTNYKIVGRPDWFQNAWEPGAWTPEEIITVYDPSDLAELKEFFDKISVVGGDTETTGPQVKNDRGYSMNPVNPETRMVLLQLGNEDQVYLIEPELVHHFKYVLESDRWLKLFHNAIYDHKWLLVKYGVHMSRVYCSMLAEQVIVAGLMAMRVNLADASRRHAPFWLINKAIRDDFITLDHEHRRMTRRMAYYSARDIVLMFPLMRDQITQLKEKKLTVTAQDEFNVIWPTAEMEIQGVNLDLSVMNQIIEYWLQHEADLTRDIFEVYAKERKEHGVTSASLFPELDGVFNLKSGAKKMAALKAIDIDLDNIQRDSLKDVSKNKDFTEGQRRLATLLAEFSNVTKMTTTYGKNMLDKINVTTQRWHPRFKQLGSGEEEGRKSGGDEKTTIATGRFSSDAQTFPKPKDLFAPVCNPAELKQAMLYFAPQIAAIRAMRSEQKAA